MMCLKMCQELGPEGTRWRRAFGLRGRAPRSTQPFSAGCSDSGLVTCGGGNSWGTTDEQTETLRGTTVYWAGNQLAVPMVTIIIIIIVKRLHPLVGSM